MIYVAVYCILAAATAGMYLAMTQFKVVQNGSETGGVVAAGVLWPLFLPLALGAIMIALVSRTK